MARPHSIPSSAAIRRCDDTIVRFCRPYLYGDAAYTGHTELGAVLGEPISGMGMEVATLHGRRHDSPAGAFSRDVFQAPVCPVNGCVAANLLHLGKAARL
jgi:hypothetical protein